MLNASDVISKLQVVSTIKLLNYEQPFIRNM
jgi:hypothetical protein